MNVKAIIFYLSIAALNLNNAIAMDSTCQQQYNKNLENGWLEDALDVLLGAAQHNDRWAKLKLVQLKKAPGYTKMPDQPRPDDISYVLILKDRNAERHFQIAEKFSNSYPEASIDFYTSAEKLHHQVATAKMAALRKLPEYTKPRQNSLIYFLAKKDQKALKQKTSEPPKTFEDQYFEGTDPYNQGQGSKMLLEAAAKNDANAHFALGMNLQFGKNGHEIDQGKAMMCFLRAVAGDHLLAHYFGAMLLFQGEHDEQIQAGINYLRKAAALGLAEAQFELAARLQKGHKFLKQSTEKAKMLYKLAVKQNHVGAMFSLGQMYADRFLSERRDKDAIKGHELIKKAADRGFPGGHEALLYYEGKFNQKSFKRTVQKELINMALTGNAIGLLADIPNSFVESTETPEILNVFRKKADLGELESQIVVAIRFYNGVGVVRDPLQALKYYEMAANNGAKDAVSGYIGIIFFENLDLENGAAQAYFWLNQAMEKRDSNWVARKYLGLCYLCGIGISRDLQKAREILAGIITNDREIKNILSLSEEEHLMGRDELYEWGKKLIGREPKKALALLKLSSDFGHNEAQYEVACCFKNGIGVKANHPRAVEWLKLSARSGNIQAIAELRPNPEQDSSTKKKRKKKRGEARHIALPVGTIADISPVHQEHQEREHSFEALLQAAQGNDSHARFEVGMIYFYGNNEITSNPQLAKAYLLAFLATNVDAPGNENDILVAKELLTKIDGNWKYNPKTIHRESNDNKLGHKYCHEGKNLANPYLAPIKDESALVAPVTLPPQPEGISELVIKFSRTPNFVKNLKALGLGTDASSLERLIAQKPVSDMLLQGFDNKGIFKLKFHIDNSQPARAVYQYDGHNRVRLLLAYSKGTQENISPAQINYIKQVMNTPWKTEK